MKKEDLSELAKSLLGQRITECGHIFYSSAATVQKGNLYILGYNPGGAGGNTIKMSIDSMLSSTENAYLDEDWTGKGKGEAPLQLRLHWLVKQLGFDLRDVCASNLLFFRSSTALGVNFKSDAQLCWPFHEAVLEIVQPRLILVFGNSRVSPFAYIHSLYGGQVVRSGRLGEHNWVARAFGTAIQGRPTIVVGLPHLSRYSPVKNIALIDWIKQQIV